jgi:HSP20 family protein
MLIKHPTKWHEPHREDFRKFKENLAMTVITRWDPVREFSTLQGRMNHLLRNQFAQHDGSDEALTSTSFAPAVDVYEDEHQVSLKLEVPGIDEKDIDVRIENNTLTVHGERKFEKEEKEENFRRIERQYGSFTRSFTLPNTVNTEQVNATYDKGILKITLPKKQEAKPKQIKINVNGASSAADKTIESKQPKSTGHAA